MSTTAEPEPESPESSEPTEGGPLKDIDGNAPLILSDPERIWMIGSGAVDVFASHVTAGQPDGSRVHLFRAANPQVLFGIKPNRQRTDMALLAIGLPGTRLVTLSRERLIKLTEVLGFSGEALAWVDNWVAQLSATISRQSPPARSVLLEPGQTIELAADTIAHCAKGTLWVRQLAGSVQFMDRIPLTTGAGEFFPVPQQTWLRAHADSRIEVIDTETCLRQDPDWSGLEEFHNAVLQCVIWNTDETLRSERDRLQRKSLSDLKAMDFALAQLAGVLGNGQASTLPVGRGASSPLIEACKLVAAPLGITVTPVPASPSGPGAPDPLQDVARAWRMRFRKVALRGAWWRGDHLPLLGFIEAAKASDPASGAAPAAGGDVTTALQAGDRPVALLPTSPNSYDIVDPADGSRAKLTAESAAKLAWYAYTFYRPMREKAMNAVRLVTFGLKGCSRDLWIVVAVSVLGGLIAMALPIATGLIFDHVIPSAERHQLVQLGVALLVCAVVGLLFSLTRNIAILRVEGRMNLSIEAGVWDRLLSLPVAFFRQYSSGDLANRAAGVDEIRHTLTYAALSTIVSTAFFAFNFALMVYYDIRLALLTVGLLILGVIISSATSYAQLHMQRRYYDIAGRIAGTVLEFVTGIAKLRASGAERRAFAVWADQFAEQKRVSFRVRSVGNALSVFDSVFPVVTTLVLFASVAYMVGKGSLSTGAFLAFNAAMVQCLASIMDISDSATSVLQVAPLYERTKPILETEPEATPARTDPGELTGAIEISHLSFRYRADGPLILDDITIQIRPGEFVAFVGPSGAGKSTIFRLLLGFETPVAGAVYFDGQDLAGLDLPSVRRRMGVVMQNAKLIPGDIFSNIVGTSNLTIEDAWEAARRAGLDEDIQEMPMGMHTVIGEGGATFSGGQRQRLMIARAIVARPRILLFDEATSALDNRTQAIVSKSLDALQATRIVIAHRLSTIRNADQIYVLTGGKVAQRGTYDELINEKGPFATLARRQLA